MPGTAAAVGTAATSLAVSAGLTGFALTAAIGLGQVLAIGALIGVSVGLGLLSKAIFPSIAETASGRVLTFRQPITSRRVIYGEVRVSGVLTYIEGTPNNANENLFQVLTIAGHPVEEIGEVYIDGEPVIIDSGGAVRSGVYGAALDDDVIIRIIKGLGTEAGDAEFNNALMTSTTGWTENHKQTGCAKVFVSLHYDRGKKFVGAMPVISFRVKGKQVFDPRDLQTKYSNNAVLCLRDYLLDTDFGLGESASRIGPAFLSAINISEERISVDVTRNFIADAATDTITLSSAATGFVVSDRVILLTDGTLPGGLSLSTDYFLIPVTDTDFKLALSPENAAAGIFIDITYTGSGTHSLVRQYRETFTVDASSNEITAANRIAGLETGDGVEVSTDGALPGGLSPATDYFYIRKTDTSGLIALTFADALTGIAIDITDAGSGNHTLHRTTEPRYTCNGTFDTNQTPEGIIGQLLSAVNGSLVYQSGFWNTYVAFEPPTLDALDEGDLDGPIQVSTLISKRDLFNGVKGQFSSVDKDFVPTDFPAITNSTYLEEDGDERIWQDIDLPFTTSSSMAQRIAKIQLEKVRQQISVVLRCNLKAFRYQAGDTIKINNTRFGWVEKLFSIEDWKFAIRQGGGTPQLGIDLFCRETAAEVYDWNSGEETRIDIAPNTNFPDPFTVLPPTGLIVVEELYTTTEGAGVKSRVRLTWTASLDAFVLEYEVQCKLLTDPEFEVKGTTRDIQFVLNDLAVGVYVFRVFSINTLAVKSIDFIEQTLEIVGLLAPPAALQNMTISAIGGLAIIRWDQSPDLDVREGGKIVFRHSNLFGGAMWSNSVSIGDAIPGTETVAVLPLKPGTYLARAVDASKISGPVVSVETTQATALEYTNISILSEHPVFAGDKTNLVVDAGILMMDGMLNIDDWPDFDAVPNFDSEGGIASEGTYIFDGGFDFGSVVRKRLTTLIEVLVINVLDDIDSRLNNIDDWTDFDGTEVADADVQVFVRHTNDDPGVSPTWSEYQRLDSAEFNARAFEFKAEFTTSDLSYNIDVFQLTITADEVA